MVFSDTKEHMKVSGGANILLQNIHLFYERKQIHCFTVAPVLVEMISI